MLGRRIHEHSVLYTAQANSPCLPKSRVQQPQAVSAGILRCDIVVPPRRVRICVNIHGEVRRDIYTLEGDSICCMQRIVLIRRALASARPLREALSVGGSRGPPVAQASHRHIRLGYAEAVQPVAFSGDAALGMALVGMYRLHAPSTGQKTRLRSRTRGTHLISQRDGSSASRQTPIPTSTKLHVRQCLGGRCGCALAVERSVNSKEQFRLGRRVGCLRVVQRRRAGGVKGGGNGPLRSVPGGEAK